MDSSTHQSYQIQNSQPNSGLLRFCSAPSSLLANSNDNSLDCGVNKGGFGSDRLISLFMNSSGSGDGEIEEKPGKQAVVNYANSQPTTYSGLLPHISRQSSFTESSSMYGLYELLRMDQHSQGKSVTSSLMRQSSSLPGVLTNFSVQNGYASSVEDLGNYCGLNGINGELSPYSNRLKNQNSFSSRTPSSLGILSQVSEIGRDNIGANNPNDDINLGNNNSDARFYGTGYHYGSWNNDWKFFNQNEDLGSRSHILSHHLSLPRTSNEMVAVGKFLHFQDPITCKIRAKRGCATHPRSIAERVRRTRISERMRKIQELLPNMDKQTNTADMLDLAVEYIKDLQKQFKTLSDNRANCKCSNIQKQIHNQIV